jgi:hypothetical protein
VTPIKPSHQEGFPISPSAFQIGLEQTVEVDDGIFHLGIVDGALGLASPGVWALA